MARVHRLVECFADGKAPVLVVGESGVGKEHVAKLLHQWSQRSDGSFLAVNCAVLPEAQAEAELFGVERRVATGVDPRPGWFRSAAGGTLFLDEIGEMAPRLQAKLLRVLQGGEVQPLGGEPRRVNVRVVAATNADLPAALESGRFRMDLYHRLSACEIEVPPLRRRLGDVPVLVRGFLRQLAEECGREVLDLPEEVMLRLASACWPGNVRQLENVLRRMVYLGLHGSTVDARVIEESGLGAAEEEIEETSPGAPEAPSLPDDLDLRASLVAEERRVVLRALFLSDGNKSRAARLLKVPRNTLAYRLDRLGLA